MQARGEQLLKMRQRNNGEWQTDDGQTKYRKISFRSS